MVTKETVDQAFREMEQYQKVHFGTKNGPDFPVIAEALATSAAFRDICVTQAMLGLLNAAELGRRKKEIVEGGDKAAQDLMQEMEHSPLRDGLATMFYVGYKLGQKEAEVRILENL